MGSDRMEVIRRDITANKMIKMNRLFTKLMSRNFWLKSIYRLFTYVLLMDLAFIFLFPFIHMLVTSLKTPLDVLDITVKWVPRSLYWQNYTRALKALDYGTTFINSVIITTLGTIGHVISCSFAAYGFARYRFPLRNFLFTIVLITIIIPVQVVIFPLVIQYSNMGWLNTHLPLIVPTFFGFGLRGSLFVFIFHQFFLGLPYELEEAARIDGCGAIRTYWKIVLPVAKTSVLVCTVLSMVWHWNDYFEPSIYIMKPQKLMLPAKLPTLYQNLEALSKQAASPEMEIIYNEAIVMAATFLVILPVLIVYLILQRKFMEGIERSGLVG